MALHVFVAMPFNIKEGINFDKVYYDYIKSALEDPNILGDEPFESFEVFRADEELIAGNIRTDMFQELLLADLVVADLSIDNPNVWYELGVRHALKARGVIQIMCRKGKTPFDIYTDRSLHYHVKDGVPDVDYIEADKQALARMAKETIESWHGRKISPVYHLLPYLKEPDWKKLVGEKTEFWEKYKAWEKRIKVARRKDRPGDILVLAEEVPVNALRVEAYRRAGQALVKLKQFKFGLEQFEHALKFDPGDLASRQQKGILLGRLGKHHEARGLLEGLISEYPNDAETLALLGRVEKDAWVDAWRKPDKKQAQMREDASYEDVLLREAIKLYKKAFIDNPVHYYSGVNALTLMHLLHDLTGDDDQKQLRQAMEGGMRWLLESELAKERADSHDYWARVTLGDLEVLLSDTPTVERAYKNAVAVAENDWFSLDSSRQQLLILRDLGYRPEQVAAALKIFERALKKLHAPWQPRQVFLFSGHMIDATGRDPERFPPRMEQIAATSIAGKLDELQAGPGDLAMCGGACGGDILFAEACLERGLHLDVRIPFDEPMFLKKSVTFAGERWRERFDEIKGHDNTTLYIALTELGATPKDVNPYERNNLWQLYTALAWGAEKIRFVCLWNRKGGDGAGGTQHMFQAVEQRSGHSYVIDTNELIKEL
jgi:tetratricopeptide (TPR) repeat protein